MVTHQLQVERRTGKVRQSETDVPPLCHEQQHVGIVTDPEDRAGGGAGGLGALPTGRPGGRAHGGSGGRSPRAFS